MNIISKQYYEFLSTLQEIFRIINSKEVKIIKIDEGIICFQNEKGNNIEISTAHDVVQYCSNDYKNRELFMYDGVKIQPIGKGNDESVSKVSLVYNQKEINFFSFVVNCLAQDYGSPKKNKELKKALSVEQIVLYLEKFIIDPVYAPKIYSISEITDNVVGPLGKTIDQIKNFLEQNQMRYFNRLSIDKENKTISFGFVSKEIIMSQSDISAINENRYNIDYYGSILKCLGEEIKSNVAITRHTFTADQFYAKLLLYNRRFDCLMSKKSTVNTTEGQKTDEFTNVQETSTSPSYTQTLINPSIKHKGLVANNTKNQEISKTTNVQSESTGHYMPLSHTQTPARLSTEHSDLIPCKPNSNEQQFSTSSLVLVTVIPGLIILLLLALAYYRYKKRSGNEVRTGINAVEMKLIPLNNINIV
ncbi:hypothetical protein [Candidatus Mesenet endosymbiont of Agriotes lineatus]|uniref:hypothetical protein n=1 Tax=Candidatus Mesenet endosymbiont of Agriotes lineatus TaxID=3077948 RepID=UPI0030D5E2A2